MKRLEPIVTFYQSHDYLDVRLLNIIAPVQREQLGADLEQKIVRALYGKLGLLIGQHYAMSIEEEIR